MDFAIFFNPSKLMVQINIKEYVNIPHTPLLLSSPSCLILSFQELGTCKLQSKTLEYESTHAVMKSIRGRLIPAPYYHKAQYPLSAGEHPLELTCTVPSDSFDFGGLGCRDAQVMRRGLTTALVFPAPPTKIIRLC